MAIHGLLWVALVLNTVSIVYTPNRATSVVIAANYVLIGPLLVGSGWVIRECVNEE
jgi:hypothetical protein